MDIAQELAEAATRLRAEAEETGSEVSRLVGKVLDDAAADYASYSREVQALIAGVGEFRGDARVSLAREILRLPRPAGLRPPVHHGAPDGETAENPVREVRHADDRSAARPDPGDRPRDREHE